MEFQPPDNKILDTLGDVGKEYGSTTGRRRQCNFPNLNNLCCSLRVNNCNICIINKMDVLKNVGVYFLYYNDMLREFDSIQEMQMFICGVLKNNVDKDIQVIFSYSKDKI